MRRTHAIRRSVAVILVLLIVLIGVSRNPDAYRTEFPRADPVSQTESEALEELDS